MTGTEDWVDAAVAREHGLTPRQVDILAGLARGWTDAQIGRDLFLAGATVHTHTKALFLRMQVGSRAAAVAMAYDVGILRTRAMRAERALAAGLRVVA